MIAIRSIFLFICITTFIKVNGQQTTLYSHYMFNGLVINPAFTGSLDALSISMVGRRQWAGYEGAPQSFTITAHSPINSAKVSLGLIANKDEISVFRHTHVSGIYAYRIRFSKTKSLAMAIQFGVNNDRVNYSSLTQYQPNDPKFGDNDLVSITPQVGAGLYYATSKFYLGLSAPKINSKYLLNKTILNNLELENHYFINSGYLIDIKPDFKIKPNMLLKYNRSSMISYDINLNLLWHESLWFGVSYRNSKSILFLTQVNITDQLKVGYSFDWGIKGVSNIYSNSHELVLHYIFAFEKNKIITPRYFY